MAAEAVGAARAVFIYTDLWHTSSEFKLHVIKVIGKKTWQVWWTMSRYYK